MKIYKFIEQPTVNEELLNGLVNFFKNLWKKTALEISKMENDPNRIKDYIVNNTLNSTSANSIFKNEFDNFKKTKNPNDLNILNFINEILNPENGVLGKQGIGNLFNEPSLRGDKVKAKRIAFEFIINSARDFIIKKIKYDLKDNKFSRDQNTGKFIDNNLLSELKKEMPDANKLDINRISTWIDNNVFKSMQTFVKSIKEDDINKAIEKGGAKLGAMSYAKLKDLFDAGTPVIYLLKGQSKDSYNSAKKPEEQPNIVGVKKIETLDDKNTDSSVIFLDKNGNPTIKKSYDDIIGAATEIGGNELKAKEALGKIKNDDVKMGKVAKFASFLSTATPEQQANIDKIIGA